MMANSRGSSKKPDPPKPEDDTDIWQRAMRDTEPLAPRRRRATELDVEDFDAPLQAQPTSNPAVRRQAVPAKRNSALPPAVPGRLDKHVVRRLKRGAQNIEARLDLHGMTQKEAHADLRHFIRDTAARGCRCVLVITGKGSRSDSEADFRDSPRGVLRRMVPQWLSAPDLSMHVSGFEPALPQHGGAGALYVQLRRVQPGGKD
tara:strand:+ start:3959 stop:4567 length:609 start_codon:yes stop_codon:yes gene_type:complete